MRELLTSAASLRTDGVCTCPGASRLATMQAAQPTCFATPAEGFSLVKSPTHRAPVLRRLASGLGAGVVGGFLLALLRPRRHD